MIELYTWGTPNGRKVSIMLEEIGLPYNVHPINIREGEQFTPEFVAINPNSKIPAIIDSDGPDGQPITMFESGAILIYLAEKTGQFLPTEIRPRAEVLQWLMWQMGGLGPMLGQNHHFNLYAPEKIPYAINRYVNETSRLYQVLDNRLADREYVAGPYSIADMACYPWILPARQSQNLDDFPELKRGQAAIAERPATVRAYALARTINTQPTVDGEASRRVLFGQSRETVR